MLPSKVLLCRILQEILNEFVQSLFNDSFKDIVFAALLSRNGDIMNYYERAENFASHLMLQIMNYYVKYILETGLAKHSALMIDFKVIELFPFRFNFNIFLIIINLV